MVRHTLKILQQMLQDFQSVSDHFGKLCIKVLKMKFKHGDSFKTATRHYRQFDFYVQKNNINKPRDEEDVLVTLLLDSTTTLICDSRAICTGVEDK